MIYIDDGSGATPLAVGEPMRGAADGQTTTTRVHLGIDPGELGDGPRVRLNLFTNLSRPQIHLAIVRSTFLEAGWGVAEDKVQLGTELDLLGLGLDANGDGCMYVPETKRLGMLEDIDGLLDPVAPSVPREALEELTGRCSHLAQVVCEGNPYLQPFYRMLHHTLTDYTTGVKRHPRHLAIRGVGVTQTACVEALGWWKATLQRGVTVPLAPRRHFPAIGERGCAYFFTDAAREDGCGFGGHSLITAGNRSFFIFHEQRWRSDALRALQANRLSMPAGECYGAVLFADALIRALGGVSHLVCFTDSDATAKALVAGGSGAPQLNFLVEWLQTRHPSVMFLGVHQRGVRNGVADALSRKRSDGQRVVREAAATGAEVVELQFSPSDASMASALLDGVMACPLRR
jgi:hypothetical protein